MLPLRHVNRWLFGTGTAGRPVFRRMYLCCAVFCVSCKLGSRHRSFLQASRTPSQLNGVCAVLPRLQLCRLRVLSIMQVIMLDVVLTDGAGTTASRPAPLCNACVGCDASLIPCRGRA